MNFKYDIIVVGAGHAGCEAAAAAANMGSKTLLITMDMNKIAQMSCNPAVGGIAKGQIVREIDALGGQMGIVTDKTAIQFRMLNKSKGPAMWSPRAQSDRARFIMKWREIIENTDNLFIWQDTVTSLIVQDKTMTGVKTAMGVEFSAKAVVLTNGTFLNGLMHIGKTQLGGGRVSEPASFGITEQLRNFGFTTDRMKTGTPARIDGRSVDFSLMDEQKGDDDFHKFSYLDYAPRTLKQLSCWITYTNDDTHSTLRDGLDDSPLYNGQIKSIGPRYCPSIETKIVTFEEKTSHQLFLEPEGESTQEYYLNGFSSSLPLHTQIEALQKIPAFRNIHIYRPGYAIEYDFFDPTQLKHTLETKLVKNLFFAGQINGTTGYEEAGGQGLIAGINAHINTHGGNEFVLKRDEAYIGVLIDDLVTKGVDEPYRMFTSRAEYRLLLREENADLRLSHYGYELGLISKEQIDKVEEKRKTLQEAVEFMANTWITAKKETLELLESIGEDKINDRVLLIDLIGRNTIDKEKFDVLVPSLKELDDYFKEQIIIEAKYYRYIQKQQKQIEKMKKMLKLNIPENFSYRGLPGLSNEVVEKLEKHRPPTLYNASLISGITPAALDIIHLNLNMYTGNKNGS